jgi:hypothetical protein
MSVPGKPTCGELYKDAFTRHVSGPVSLRAFTAGFVTGQAEKVYLGACRATMFRPSAEYHQTVEEAVTDTAMRYGLFTVRLDYGIPDHPVNEFWLCRTAEDAGKVGNMALRFEVNSVEWHQERATLCGVPDTEVDVRYHERSGYGERAD